LDRGHEILLSDGEVLRIGKEARLGRCISKEDDEDAIDGVRRLRLQRLGDPEVITKAATVATQDRRHQLAITLVGVLIAYVKADQIFVRHTDGAYHAAPSSA